MYFIEGTKNCSCIVPITLYLYVCIYKLKVKN